MARIWICLALALIITWGCSNRPAGPRRPLVNYINHTVRYEGETLGLIARWYTRSSDTWKEILSHNPNLDVYRIRKGQIILIPEYLVKRDAPLPADFVQASKAPLPSETPAAVEEAQQAAEPETETTPSADQAAAQAEAELSAQPLLEREPLGPPEEALPEAGRSAPPAEPEPTTVPTATELSLPPTELPQATAVPSATPIPRAKSRDELLRELLESPSNE